MQCKEKPQGDKYGFTSFALELCSGKGLDPLPSDSRRRGDRHALHVSEVCLALATQIPTKQWRQWMLGIFGLSGLAQSLALGVVFVSSQQESRYNILRVQTARGPARFACKEL